MTVEASPERVHQAADILQSHMQPVLMGDKAGVKLDVWLSAEIGPHVSGRKVFDEEPGGAFAREAGQFTLEEREEAFRELLKRLGADLSSGNLDLDSNTVSYQTRYPRIKVVRNTRGREVEVLDPLCLYHWLIGDTKRLSVSAMFETKKKGRKVRRAVKRVAGRLGL